MAELTDEEIDVAERRGRDLLNEGPRAVSAAYDRGTGPLVVQLDDGCAHAMLTRPVEDRHGAQEADFGAVEIDGAGLNPGWSRRDADLFVPHVLSGLFGRHGWGRGQAAE